MIYILGISHTYQSCPNNAFNKFITDFIELNHITHIAEEFSKEAGQSNNPKYLSKTQLIAYKLNLQYLYCDPDSNERELLKIFNSNKPNSEGWNLRETEWLNRLTIYGFLAHSVLLLIGYKHLKTFPLKLKGIEFNILETKQFKSDIPIEECF